MADDDNTDLEVFVGALGQMFEQSEDAVRDGAGSPPFSMMFNPDTAPVAALAWLGQFVGVKPEIQSAFESDVDFYARQRQRIKDHLGFARGSAASMMAAAALYLTGNKTVLFRERDGSAYHLTVVTRTGETPDPDKVERALFDLKPAGITLDYHTIAGRDFAEVKASGMTFATVASTYTSFDDLRGF